MANVIHRLIDRGIGFVCGDCPRHRLPLGFVQRLFDARSRGLAGFVVRDGSWGKYHRLSVYAFTGG